MAVRSLLIYLWYVHNNLTLEIPYANYVVHFNEKSSCQGLIESTQARAKTWRYMNKK